MCMSMFVVLSFNDDKICISFIDMYVLSFLNEYVVDII
jgi:hypothetical protein